jgi:hypothetical protein
MAARAEFSYINVDFDDLVNALVAKIPTLTDKWTDFNPDSIGMTLVDLMASTGSMMIFYANRNAQALLFPTVRELKHSISWSKLVDSKVLGPSSARTTLQFTLESASVNYVSIPKWTKVTSLGDYRYVYRTIQPAYIFPGSLSVDVPAMQGDLVTDSVGPSDGSISQMYQLNYLAAENSVQVFVSGIEYYSVDTWADSYPESKHFKVVIDYLGRSFIYFGDGVRGKIPPTLADITVYYLRSDADDGNRGSGTIRYLEDNIVDSEGRRVAIRVTNIDDATGGDGTETVEEFKKRLPAEIRAGWKAHSKEDFISLTEAFPGV